MDGVDGRARLATALDYQDVPDSVWTEIMRKPADDEDQPFDFNNADDFADVLSLTHRLLRVREATLAEMTNPSEDGHARHPGQWSNVESHRVSMELSRSIGERECAVELAYARAAGDTLDVRAWRREMLNGAVLSTERALRFLQSPLLRWYRAGVIQRLKIPMVEHKARIEHDAQGWRSIAVHWGRKGRANLPWPSSVAGIVAIQYWNPSKQQDETIMATDTQSVVGRLGQLGEQLCQQFGWRVSEAVWFVLTDDPPRASALDVTLMRTGSRTHRRVKIMIEADAWLPAGEILAAYRSGQLQGLGHKNYRVSEKQVALFKHVIEHTPSGAPRPPWKTLTSSWDQAHEADDAGRASRERWQYGEENWKRMSRDFGRAERSICQLGRVELK